MENTINDTIITELEASNMSSHIISLVKNVLKTCFNIHINAKDIQSSMLKVYDFEPINRLIIETCILGGITININNDKRKAILKAFDDCMGFIHGVPLSHVEVCIAIQEISTANVSINNMDDVIVNTIEPLIFNLHNIKVMGGMPYKWENNMLRVIMHPSFRNIIDIEVINNHDTTINDVITDLLSNIDDSYNYDLLSDILGE